MSDVRWGAHPAGDGMWQFGLWAPDVKSAQVELDGTRLSARSAPDGWWHLSAPAHAGQHYMWVLDGAAYPDPAARAQAGDVHAASVLVDPAYNWQAQWRGRSIPEAVIYELHVGTFTAQGTFAAAAEELPRLRELGVTMIELMPLAQFEGDRGWGYDGVLPYAPHPAYGSPDDMRAFIDAAHAHGIGVLLDVVYNHFGPSGNYLGAWCPSFFHPERASPWGAGIAFETPAARAYFIANAQHWLEEYQLDGLRLDAVHAIEDHSPTHFLDELGKQIRARAYDRPIHLVTEDERNLTRYFTPQAPYDATWNDDWHHAVHCLLTGEDESYYAPFAHDPVGDIATALADGYVEQGQPRVNGDAHPRGEPSAQLPGTAFVNFLGNHDQVGNRARGERLHQLVDDGHAYRVMTALTLLAPFTPMLFMGDEFLTSAPFQFFVDFTGDLAEAVRKGRAQEFARFSSFGGAVPDPVSARTFRDSKIGRPETQAQRDHLEFVTHLLTLRARHVTPLLARVPSPEATVDRRDDLIDVCWSFAPGTIHMRGAFGPNAAFVPHPDPALLLTDGSSPFALSATFSPE